MRYALLADIHGNAHALRAVLDNAKRRQVDRYILLGDYYLSCAYPNEVTQTIRMLGPLLAVSGNEETHLHSLLRQDQSAWTDGQMQALYQSCRALSGESKAYLMRLPEQAAVTNGDVTITAFHDFDKFFGVAEARNQRISSHNVSLMVRKDGLSPEQAVAVSMRRLLSNVRIRQSLACFADGVYAFGHNHLQYHLEIDGKLCVNPGSCGLPLDGVGGAPSSILDIAGSAVTVEEHRAAYDADQAVADIVSSPLYPPASVWYDIIVMELTHHLELAGFFLHYAENYAQAIGDPVRPYRQSTWTAAFAKWKLEEDIRPLCVYTDGCGG